MSAATRRTRTPKVASIPTPGTYPIEADPEGAIRLLNNIHPKLDAVESLASEVAGLAEAFEIVSQSGAHPDAEGWLWGALWERIRTLRDLAEGRRVPDPGQYYVLGKAVAP